ncbi:MAG: ATP synthase F1 subunit epsilon [Oscillospiraceae bacterium]|nr:ATP synthase F1 subunit epsilon [Oscillospiraceae bacterium]MCR5304875.1 ATP synthase F1 subunit epsilon [Oscillospiraceae bacterium]
MNNFPLQIITPDKIFFDGSVQRLVVRTTEGDIGILAKHEKYVAALPSGPVRITLEDGSERVAALSGGALKVSPSHTAILANAVEWAEDIDVEWAKRSEEDARRRKEQSKTKQEQDLAELKLKRALNRLRVSGMK